MAREEQEKLDAMTPEEREEMEQSIPEWKRNALTTTEAVVEEEQKGMFGSLKDRVGSTDAGKKFIESDEYQKIKDVRGNYKDFKSKLAEGVENTQNPTVQKMVQVADYAYHESSCARAIKAMEAYDPYFKFDELEVEASDIFQEFYVNFLAGNLEYIETVAGGPALAICKGEFKRRTTEGWMYRYEEMLDCADAVFNSG